MGTDPRADRQAFLPPGEEGGACGLGLPGLGPSGPHLDSLAAEPWSLFSKLVTSKRHAHVSPPGLLFFLNKHLFGATCGWNTIRGTSPGQGRPRAAKAGPRPSSWGSRGQQHGLVAGEILLYRPSPPLCLAAATGAVPGPQGTRGMWLLKVSFPRMPE